MFTDDHDQQFDLAGAAVNSTASRGLAALGWLLLLALAITTAVHAMSITRAYTGLAAGAGDLFSIIRLAGVILVEAFAVVTAGLLATHKIRAKQQLAAIAIEATWAIFAAVNLISSFSIEHGGALPQFVGYWITYGLPISALVVGIEFYIMLRLDPAAARAEDDQELRDYFVQVKHRAKLEVMASPQMLAVIRQMTWQQLPPIVGREMNLSEAQIRALIAQAPELLNLAAGREDEPDRPAAQGPAPLPPRVKEPALDGRGNGHFLR